MSVYERMAYLKGTFDIYISCDQSSSYFYDMDGPLGVIWPSEFLAFIEVPIKYTKGSKDFPNCFLALRCRFICANITWIHM